MEHFISLEKLPLKELIKGGFAGFVQTENLTVGYTDMKPGTEIPLHHHPEEAIDIVLEGELEMQIGEKMSVLKDGMITVVPGNVPHRAVAITECKVITIFYPQRKL
jgi:quercetin dioxygenase-like cupin family protein